MGKMTSSDDERLNIAILTKDVEYLKEKFDHFDDKIDNIEKKLEDDDLRVKFALLEQRVKWLLIFMGALGTAVLGILVDLFLDFIRS